MKPVSLIVYDFDGVLTDNRVWVREDGVEMVACNRSDGWWIGEIRKLGIEQVILSTEVNPVVSARGRKLGLEVHQGHRDKAVVLARLLEARGLSPSRVVYVGNDMNDHPCMTQVGFALAPEDSHPRILAIAHWVIPARGGAGVVRHLYDWLNTSDQAP